MHLLVYAAMPLCALASPLAAQGASNPLLDSARTRLAILDGTVKVPGLDSSVEVRRDRWGVPHIYAKTQHDLFLAQGYVAAQDRLWEMDMWRRQGEGRLAEVLGPAYVERDRMARLFAYRGDMDVEWRSYAPDAKAIVHAFVDGVNAYVDVARQRPPIEYTLLGFLPERWDYEAALVRVTALSGVSNGTEELLRAQLLSTVGRELTERLMLTDPHRAIDPARGVDLAGLAPSLITSADRVFSDLSYTRVDGSNNWVVSGRKTTSGKPILANDPHRAITNPPVRYVTHLVGPGWNVIGAGEPASPGVSIGHNEQIAFGLTIVGMDQQDVYVEQVRICGPSHPGRRCQLVNGRWVPVRRIVDTIRVKGDAPRIVELEYTTHGPIVHLDSASTRAIAIRMVSQEPGTASYLASLSLDRARNWSEFLAAMGRWKMPSENMIYADVQGNIGWIAAGLMPRRTWSGLLPVPGDGRFEWSGFVPSSKLPQSFNPARGYIATANNNILPPGYQIPISYEFSPPTRAMRIHEVLRDSGRFTVGDFERLQHDDLSLLARTYAPRLVALATRAGRGNDTIVHAVATWNFHMSKDAMAPLVWEVWSSAFARQVYRAAFPSAALSVLRGQSDWDVVGDILEHPARLGSRGAGNPTRQLASIAAESLDSALTTITRRLGPDRSRWRWGAVHVAELKHPISSAFDLPPVERGGDGSTVFATGGGNLRQTSGASYREIFDLANWDASVAINVPGQSAQPGSEHYGDLLPLWAHGEYFPLAFSRARVEAETKHVLILTP
jgi:penicillin G amidase